MSKSNPKSRREQLVIQELPGEILIYDLKTNKAFCLNHTAAFVWQHADGQTPVKQIAYLLQKKLKTAVDETVVWFALEQLEKDGLLENKIYAPTLFAGMSRRQLITTLGKSAAVAVPLVIMITAPTALSAQSAGGGPTNLSNGSACTSGGQCSSGTCSSTKNTCCRSSHGGTCTTVADCCDSTDGCSSGTCSQGCVLYDTPITTADGQAVRARDVVVGQLLLGVNCINGETIAGRVKHVMEKSTNGVYSLVAENGAVVNCSPSHDLIEGFGDSHGKRAEQFREGDALLVFDRQSRKIVEAKTAAINYVEIFQPVLMFEMDTTEHTFISGGIISHNIVKA